MAQRQYGDVASVDFGEAETVTRWRLTARNAVGTPGRDYELLLHNPGAPKARAVLKECRTGDEVAARTAPATPAELRRWAEQQVRKDLGRARESPQPRLSVQALSRTRGR